ncbi:phosphoribosyltransferase [Helicobacter cappadocius]|uniref:Phosphoribosyltransferase family protein n=1 Tax=Helicobacter cappadocius TaxID=3063998 RepID=A0AA90T8Y8_9HELI|nr:MULTISPECIES: phosphoribosyltransferase family protein [unclassified Helicobacter]MDO7252430.1 phosphoribosyltransferase family protein [Helicobacter sp. faydin-H75]MDP2538297.1 phosphoribosyltransferase family protein [Helicobacter sp. faydin-H76]
MYYSYADFLEDLKALRTKVEKNIGIPDAIVCIARGGMVMSHMLSLAWNLRSIYTLNAISYSDQNVQSSLIIENMPNIKPEHKKILVVDEIVDSGKSLEEILQKLRSGNPQAEFYSAVIFQRTNAKIFADFYVKPPSLEWIDFFWEVDMLEKRS